MVCLRDMWWTLNSLGFRTPALAVILVGATVCAADRTALPGGLHAGSLLYEASLAEVGSVADWRMEGPGKIAVRDGWLELYSPNEAMHHVFWCPQRFPASFVAQWQAQNLKTNAGLCIVFFAAAGLEGESVLDAALPARDGTFAQYTRGRLRCYHASYYANAQESPDRRQTNLRKNPGFHLVQEGPEGIPTASERVHTLTLAKLGPRIRLWVDERPVIDWTDPGTTNGPPYGEGYIGFRQMQWTHFRYRDFRVWELAASSQR